MDVDVEGGYQRALRKNHGVLPYASGSGKRFSLQSSRVSEGGVLAGIALALPSSCLGR